MAEDFALAFSFPDPSESFVLGFEAGRIARRLDVGEVVDTRTEFPIHTANGELMIRMARFYGLTVELTPTAVEGWSNAVFARAPRPALKIVEPSHG